MSPIPVAGELFQASARKDCSGLGGLAVTRRNSRGTYVGKSTVSANQQQVSRRIEVHAYGFDIPERSSIEADFWFSRLQLERVLS